MEMTRRGFLKGILALGVAPSIMVSGIGRGVLMRPVVHSDVIDLTSTLAFDQAVQGGEFGVLRMIDSLGHELARIPMHTPFDYDKPLLFGSSKTPKPGKIELMELVDVKGNQLTLLDNSMLADPNIPPDAIRVTLDSLKIRRHTGQAVLLENEGWNERPTERLREHWDRPSEDDE